MPVLSRSSRLRPVLVCGLLVAGLGACQKKQRDKSSAAEWMEHPSTGTKDGNVINMPTLGVKFEIPDTLYVFKTCGEAAHTPEGDHRWIPIVTCRSGATGGGDSGDEEEGGGDPFASADEEEATGVEEISVNFYVTKKTRPLDERAVSWFENQFMQAGLAVDEISYQHEYQKKSGIYAKLHIAPAGEAPEREIVQFMFPRQDVVFIARMEYPFGEKRSVEQDWKYILWNFQFTE